MVRFEMNDAATAQSGPRIDNLPPGASRGAPAPWWAKMAVKIILSRFPLPYRAWRKIGIFRHGSLALQLSSSRERFEAGLLVHRVYGAGPVSRVLELGPGDSLGLAIAARAFGAASVFVDVGDFAAFDADAYAEVARRCAGDAFVQSLDLTSRTAMLCACGSEYLTKGLQSLRELPDGSIDFSVSTAVLEHVRLGEFDETMGELFRVTRSGGTGRHIVDVMDHLGGGLNNLRFPSRIWESDIFARSGFYTNRLRPDQMLERARRAGFAAHIAGGQRFRSPPLKRQSMAPEFSALPDDQFEIAVFEMVLSKP